MAKRQSEHSYIRILGSGEMRLLKEDDMNKLIDKLQRILVSKNDDFNSQDIDKEVAAFISVYKFGGKEAKEYAHIWLCKFSANAGIIKNTYTLGSGLSEL